MLNCQLHESDSDRGRGRERGREREREREREEGRVGERGRERERERERGRVCVTRRGVCVSWRTTGHTRTVVSWCGAHVPFLDGNASERWLGPVQDGIGWWSGRTDARWVWVRRFRKQWYPTYYSFE